MITRKHTPNLCLLFAQFLNSKKPDGYLEKKLKFFVHPL